MAYRLCTKFFKCIFSIAFKLDNSLLICNSTFVLILYSTVAKFSVFSIPKGSTGADRHLLKLNGFVMSLHPLRTASSMESSPIRSVSVKLRSSSKKVGDFSPFFSF